MGEIDRAAPNVIRANLLFSGMAFIINAMREDQLLRYGTRLLCLALAALLLGFAVILPLSHQLFHDASAEPDWCPALVMESALGLLLAFVLSSFFFYGHRRCAVVRFNRPSPPLFHCATFHANRAPPRF